MKGGMKGWGAPAKGTPVGMLPGMQNRGGILNLPPSATGGKGTKGHWQHQAQPAEEPSDKQGFPWGSVRPFKAAGAPHLHMQAAHGRLDAGLSAEMIDAADATGMTPLMVATFHGHLKSVRFLREKGADVNRKSADGATALHIAAAKCAMPGTLSYLVAQRGLDVNAMNADGFTPLMLASQTKNREAVGYLLRAKCNPNIVGRAGWTALHAAALHGLPETVQMLVNAGAKIAASDAKGFTPFLVAASAGNLPCAKVLLERGVDVNETNHDGETAALIASKNSRSGFLGWLVSRKPNLEQANEDGWTPLLHAAKAGELASVRILLQHGANIHATTKKGWTPLVVACYHGYTDVAVALSQAGADSNHVTEGGWTPLMNAAKAANYLTVKLLLGKLGATNVNAQNSKGWTALMVAAKNGNVKIVKELIDHGADVNLLNNASYSAVTIALAEGTESVAQLLIQAGCDLSNATISPAVAAASSGHVGSVRLVHEMGVNLAEEDAHGKTALTTAAELDYIAVAVYLRDAGYSVYQVTSLGYNAVDVARQKGSAEMMQKLTAQPQINSAVPRHDQIERGRAEVKKYQSQRMQRMQRFSHNAPTSAERTREEAVNVQDMLKEATQAGVFVQGNGADDPPSAAPTASETCDDAEVTMRIPECGPEGYTIPQLKALVRQNISNNSVVDRLREMIADKRNFLKGQVESLKKMTGQGGEAFAHAAPAPPGKAPAAAPLAQEAPGGAPPMSWSGLSGSQRAQTQLFFTQDTLDDLGGGRNWTI
eukprot:Rhum_TRINITY_DN10846_c0_g1::Rhum_TRINITY_DN10846_c0_g1_i1::g.40716::m.40716/K10380/ANK; ankyrin